MVARLIPRANMCHLGMALRMVLETRPADPAPTGWAGADPLPDSGNVAAHEASRRRTKGSAVGQEYQAVAARIEGSPICVGVVAVHDDAGRILLGSFRRSFGDCLATRRPGTDELAGPGPPIVPRRRNGRTLDGADSDKKIIGREAKVLIVLKSRFVRSSLAYIYALC